MKIKNKLAIGAATASLAMSSFLIMPNAMAHSKAERVAIAASKKVQSMEAQMQRMSDMMQSMQSELASVKAQAGQADPKLQELEEWVDAQKSAPAPDKESMVFFRGGFARNDTDRTGDILTDANADGSGAGTNILGLGVNTSDFTGNSGNGNQDGWYFGAGFDHHINDDLFGLMDNTDVLAEVMFEYKEFDQTDLRRAPLGTAANDSVNAALGVAGAPVCGGIGDIPALGLSANAGTTQNGAGPYGSCSNSVTVTQFSLTASPKIRFMKGSAFRPWIIPIGFAFHVISPPSDGVTYTTSGMMFGAGADYKIWKDIYVGIDARYHLVNNDPLDGVEIDGFTAGGYLGLGFD